MKTLPVLLIFLSFLHGCVTATTSAGSPEGTLNVNSTNASENSMIESDVPTSNLVKIGKVEVSRAGDIVVEILNVSKKPIKLWKDSNSWGAASWRLLLIRNGSLEVFFQNPDQEFTRNGPAFDEIPGGGHLDQKLDLNGGNWCGLGHCSIHSERGFGGKKFNFEPNDTVIVIYHVPVTQEAHDNHVWYGVIAATPTVQ